MIYIDKTMNKPVVISFQLYLYRGWDFEAREGIT